MKGERNYIAPASRTKGVHETPGWRDPERAADNWRACRRYLRRYLIAALIPALFLLWAAGYAQGAVDAARDCLPLPTNKKGIQHDKY